MSAAQASREDPQRTGVTIRRARPEDAAALSVIAWRSKASLGYEAELLALWAPQLSVSAEYIAGNHVLCACLDDEPVGFAAAAKLRKGTFELEHLWIRPDHARRGLGRRLLEALIAELRSNGADSLRIVSDPHAEGFYTRMGAHRTGFVDSVPKGRVLPELLLDL